MTLRRIRIIIYVLLMAVLLTACAVQQDEKKEEKKESADFSCNIYSSYDSEGGYCYTLLSDAEKRAYMKLAEGIFNMEKSIRLGIGDAESVERVITAVYYDYPEYFWFSRGASYKTGYFFSKVLPDYSFTKEETEKHKKSVNSYVEKVCGECMAYEEDYDRIKKAYEYIIMNTRYEKGKNDQNILSVMEDGKSVCAGYSKAMQLILRQLGYEAAYVNGYDEKSSDGTHAWNMVKVGDEWYNIDATWGDPVYNEEDSGLEKYVVYSYLMVSDEELGSSHRRANDFAYPECTSDKYDYFRLNDTYMEKYDYDVMLEKIKGAIDERKGSIEFKFKSVAEFKKAKEAAEEGTMLRKAMWHQMYSTLSLTADCSYSSEKNMRTICIFFAYD